MTSIAETLASRSVLNAETGCLEWTGYKTAWGYGQLRVKQKTLYAHRASYEAHTGTSAAGKFVCHRCDNPCCIEPTHLFLGTNEDNMKDCASKNRTARQYGEKSGKAKLTDAKALEIWTKRQNGFTNVALAIEYDIDATVVSRIASKKAWGHIHHMRSLVILSNKGLI